MSGKASNHAAEIKALEAKYVEVMEYIKGLRADLNEKLQREYGNNEIAKEGARVSKYHIETDNIARCVEYSKKISERIEDHKRNIECGNEGAVKGQIALFKKLFEDTRSNNVRYTGQVEYYSGDKVSNTFQHPLTEIITSSITSPVAMLYGLTGMHGDRVVMINPLSISRGGCVMHGQRGVEEDLCLQTNYWKALGKFVENGEYTLQTIGDVVYLPHITRLRNANFKWLNANDRTSATMIGAKFPYKVDALMHGGKAIYDKESDKKTIISLLDTVFSLCVEKNHDIVIFNNIGTGILYYPEDEFIEILRERILHYKFTSFYFCGYSGNIDQADKNERHIWIKYCKLLDNKTPFESRKDVEEPHYDGIPEFQKREMPGDDVESGSEPEN